mgnify:CR=1 FL=1
MHPDSQTRRIEDLDNALRFQKIEMELNILKDSLEKNTKATEDLVKMWNGSQWTVSFIKGCVAFAAAGLLLYTQWNKFWGH